jgi:hypothetical protein
MLRLLTAAYARDGRSMRAGECLFLGKSGRAADITAKNDFDPNSLREHP